MELVADILYWIIFGIGCASILVQLFVKIAKVTPNTKDDVIASKFEKWIGVVAYYADKAAMNLPSDKARKEKEK